MELIQIIREAENKKAAIGHFNVSDAVALKAIFEAAHEANVPVIIGTSEGERDFLGARRAVALVRSIREEYSYPIYLNADHTHSLERIKEAVEAGYDAVLFDASRMPLHENIKLTKQVVEYVKSKNPKILVEGEIGYIGSSSEIHRELPEGAAVKPEDLTTPEEAAQFVKETGVDMLAPAVGNIHGIVIKEGFVEKLYVDRISAIRSAVGVPLVLHGASGLPDEDFVAAVKAGVNIIHINTEIRAAWRKGIEDGLRENPAELAPYRIYGPALEGMKRVVAGRLKLFGKI